eukprot:5508728-Pyramimonas_sp.AAC.1
MPWRKRTRFVSANVHFAHIQRLCVGRKLCEFSGRPHIVLQGHDQAGRHRTLQAEPCPPRLCRQLVNAFSSAI